MCLRFTLSTTVTTPFVTLTNVPLQKSTTDPTGIDSASSSAMNFFLPGSLTSTVPLTGSTLTVLATTGGSGVARPSKSDGLPGGTSELELPPPPPPVDDEVAVRQVTTF